MMIEYNGVEAVDMVKLAQQVPELRLSTGAQFSKNCQASLITETDYRYALLTPSCTSAIEIMAQLMAARCMKEIIVPSYTFSTSVTPFLERGINVTFCDVNIHTGCIGPDELNEVIENKHDAVLAVSYAGNLPLQKELREICDKWECLYFEDNAQSIGNIGQTKAIKPIADLTCLSFHYTKNISCGEGGSILFNKDNYFDEIMQFINKGTDRHKFIRGDVDKYHWVSLGSSHLMDEFTACILAQNLNKISKITSQRLQQWYSYAEKLGKRFSYVHQYSRAVNGHIFALKLNTKSEQRELISYLYNNKIQATSHYTNLSNSPYAVQNFISQMCPCAQELADTIVRLPIGIHLSDEQTEYIIEQCLMFNS